MPTLDELLAGPPKRAKTLDELLAGPATSPKRAKTLDELLAGPATSPKPKTLDELLAGPSGVAPLPSPTKPEPPPNAMTFGLTPADIKPTAPDPFPTVPKTGLAGRMLAPAVEAAAGTRPFPVDPGRATALGANDAATPDKVAFRALAPYRRHIPGADEIEAAERKRALDIANTTASIPMVPRIVGDAYARRAGVSEEDIARRGQAQSPAAGIVGKLLPAAPGHGVVVGYPAPPREIPVEQSPDLMQRRRQLAEKAAAEAQPTTREALAATLTGRAPVVEPRSAPEGAGIAPRNTYGTVGEMEGGAGLDYNPIGLVLGAADELFRSGKAIAAPLVQGVTGQRPNVDTERGLLPPIEAPSVNIGRTIAGAPMAVAELVGEKVAPGMAAAARGDWGAVFDELMGGQKVGNTYTGESLAKNKGDGTFMGELAAGLNAVEDSIANTPRELWELAAMPLHAIQGAGNFAANAIRGDKPVRETYRPVVDTAAGVATGTLRDTVKMALDPKAKLEEGLLSTVATAVPFSNALGKANRVEGLAANAAKLADDATAMRTAPLGTTGKMVAEMAGEGEKLRAIQRAREADAFKAEEDARKAAAAAKLESEGYSATGEGPNLDIQAKARADEAAKARQARDDARLVADTFDAANGPALNEAFGNIAKAQREASTAKGVAIAAEFAARAPLHYATLGASAVADLVGVYLGRELNKAGAGNVRSFAKTKNDRVPYVIDIERELGRETTTRKIQVQEAYRALPDELRPEVRKALHMEHDLWEGGFYGPGHNYTEHILTHDGNGWDYTPAGRKWVNEQNATIAKAEADMQAAATMDDFEAARAKKLEAEDLLQKAEGHKDVANKYAKPLAQISNDLTLDEIDLDDITPFEAEAWKAQRQANIDAATAAHDARAAKAEAEFQKIAARYRIDTGANVRGVERIAERVIGRASQRQQTAARQADALTAAELAAQERRLAPKDRITGPAGDDAALRTREAEVGAERAANRRLGARIADVRAQAGRDIAALDRPYSEAVKGISDRAQRVIDRARQARDKAIAESAKKALAEVEALRSEPIPVGLRRVQWRQTYKTDAARDRRAASESPMAGQAMSARQSLGPTRESKQLLGSELRAAKMPMTRREIEFGQSTRLGDEVNALIKRADDVATLKLYREYANRYGIDEDAYNAGRAVDMGVENAARARRGLAPLENRGRATETGKRYLKVPDTDKFPGLKGSPKTYGALAGKYIPEDLWFEMVNHQTLKTEMAGTLNRAIALWKYGKTVLSPMTHARNFLSNALLFAPMAGISLTDPRNWGHFWNALKDVAGKEKSAFYRELETNGLYDSTFAHNELALKALDDVHSGFVDHVTGPMAGFIRGLYETGVGAMHYARKSERIARKNEAANLAKLHDIGTDQKAWAEAFQGMVLPTAGRRLREGISKITDATRQIIKDNPGAFYRAQDDVFRTALAYKMQAEGKTIGDIVAAAKRSFVDYANVPGFVQVLRAPVAPVKNAQGQQAKGARAVFFMGGQPFIAFTAAAVPMVKDWITRDPWRAQLYMNLHETLSRANLAAMGMTEDDATALRKAGRTWEQGQALVGEVFPQLGRSKDSGDPLAIDVNYLAPTGGLTPEVDPYANDFVKGVRYLQTVLNIGPGPLMAPLFDAFTMRDSFTGQRLDRPGETSGETAARVGSLLYQQLMPPIAPSLTDAARWNVDINDPTRVEGGYHYEQIVSAALGAPDYAGRERSLFEALLGVVSGSKLTRANPADRILDNAARVKQLSDGAKIAATKQFSPALRLSDEQMPWETAVNIMRSYRERMQEPIETLRQVARGLAEGEGRGDWVTRALADDLDQLAQEQDPVSYFTRANDLLSYFAEQLERVNAERRAKKSEVWGQ